MIRDPEPSDTMPRFKTVDKRLLFAELVAILADKLKPPFGIVLGSPGEVAELAAALPSSDITCYQTDLYQADRLRETLAECGHFAEVVTAADLWDLAAPVQTLLYPVPLGGERGLKLDMIEQAYHTLRAEGTFAVLSPYAKDEFFPAALKKVFGKVHRPMAGKNAVLWCRREGDRARRRHEMAFQVRARDDLSLRFLSRPGTFSYGRFDNGARALVEVMDVQEGDRVLDLGCGCGTNGIMASLRSGTRGFTTFADSNLRAIALTQINATRLARGPFETLASSTLNELAARSYDVVLANPPYYAQLGIARLFIEKAKRSLKPGGRLYLVTKQVDAVHEIMEEFFGQVGGEERRGYVVFTGKVRT
jgi:23S rRNA (guanine1835-N2)-methyltransferase